MHQDDPRGGGIYSVKRTAVNRVVERIMQGRCMHFVHGHLVSGKSLFVSQLSAMLRVKSIDVYIIDQQSEFIEGELEQIAKESSRSKVVVIENYERHLEHIRFCISQFRTNVSLVLTARTYLHEATKRDVSRLNVIKIPEYSLGLDRLDVPEANYLVRALSSDELRGVFPENASPEYIRQAIRGVCEDRMGEVLLFFAAVPSYSKEDTGAICCRQHEPERATASADCVHNESTRRSGFAIRVG